jgi:Asp-tRNA(Asn)/Glu-tRNA(Gln) amidotransferase C subunit
MSVLINQYKLAFLSWFSKVDEKLLWQVESILQFVTMLDDLDVSSVDQHDIVTMTDGMTHTETNNILDRDIVLHNVHHHVEQNQIRMRHSGKKAE